jgi:6-phosphogluconolactonase
MSKKADGGIYCITGDDSKHITSLPTVNYLISGSRYYYATSSRNPQSAAPVGAVTVLAKVHFPHCALGILQCVSAEGKTPCHLTLSPDEKFLYTANYSSGDISEFRLKDSKIAAPPRIIRHSGKSVTPRQKSPHPHFTGFSPDGKQLFVCDLGTDEIFIYNYSSDKGLLLPCAEKLKLPAGSGPRHLVFAPDGKTLYTANELNSTSSSFVKSGNTWKLHKTISTLKEKSTVRNSPGAIKITEDGKFFFITNRGHNSIAFFETAPNGDFNLLQAVPSSGNFPSDIILLDNEKKLAVSHLKSGTVHFFKFDPKAKTLTAEQQSLSVKQAIGLCK